MLDLRRDIVGNDRPLAMKGFDEAQRVTRAVQKVGIAERDMLGAGGRLPPDVFQDHLRLHDAEDAAVDGHDRAVTALVLASTAGFGVADPPGRAVYYQLRV